MRRLEGKKALVTGGTRGIGKAIARLFAEQGADVAIFATNKELGEAVIAELKNMPSCKDQQFLFHVVDVADHAVVKESVESVLKEFGHVDILVNSAGITKDGLFMRMEEDDWDRVLDVNLKSVYNTSKHLIRSMMKRKHGRIINITSVVGAAMGNPGQVNYAASKAGMVGFTIALAKEVASRGITVNAIAPGFIDSDMTDKLTDEQKTGLLNQIPAGKMGRVEDIARAALFLASSDADYVTGHTLVVDGGMTA